MEKGLSVVKTVWSLILLSVLVGFLCWAIVALTSGGEKILESIVNVFQSAATSLGTQEPVQ